MAQPTIAPEAAPTQTPDIPQLASAGAMGGEVAAAGADLAQGVTQRLATRNEINLKNQYEDQLTQAQLRIASGREALSAQIDNLQRDPNLDVKTYTNQVHGLFDQMASGVMDGVTNTRIQRQLTGQLGDMKAQYGEQAGNWQTVQQAGLVGAGANQLFSQIGGQAYQAPNPGAISTLNNQIGDYVHGLPGLTPDQRQALITQGVSQNAANFGYGLADRDPAQARALFDHGWFSENGLKDQQLHVLDRAIRLGETRDAEKARAGAALGDAQLNIAGETVMRTIDAGGSPPVPDVVALAQQVRARAEAGMAAGKPKPDLFALADRLDGAVSQMHVKAEYALQAPPDIQAAAEAMQAEAARRKAAGQPITLQEGARLTAITAQAKQTMEAVQTDPWSLAAPRGIAPTPLDPNNPASYTQRAQQAQMLEQVLKLPYAVPPLQKSEAEALAKQAVTENGRMGALATLDYFDPVTRTLAARQAMPNDGAFAIEAGLDPAQRAAVQQGRERAANDPNFWKALPADHLPGDRPPAEAHLRALDQRVDAMFGSYLSQTDIAGIKASARNWIAGQMVGQGKGNGIALTDNDVTNGLTVAMGGGVTTNGTRVGGPGVWAGNPDFIYAIPHTINSAGFSMRVQNQAAADRAKGVGPVNVDGTPFNLNQAKPVFIGNGQYRWDTPAGAVMTAARPKHPPTLYITHMPQ